MNARCADAFGTSGIDRYLDVRRTLPSMREYKVITEKDSSFRGKFDPEAIEGALNEYAADGWRVINALHIANVMKSFSAQVMVVLERSDEES